MGGMALFLAASTAASTSFLAACTRVLGQLGRKQGGTESGCAYILIHPRVQRRVIARVDNGHDYAIIHN